MCNASITINDVSWPCHSLEDEHTGRHVTRVPLTQIDIDGFEWEITNKGDVVIDMAPFVAQVVFHIGEETTLYDDAVQAYREYCDRTGAIYEQTNGMLSASGTKYVHLRNGGRLLAKYDIHNKKIVES